MEIDFCVECGSYNINYVNKPEIVNVRGEEYTVSAYYWLCNDCGADFKCLGDGNDYLADAYRLYREKHNMLQPEEIKSIRERYGLNQEELSDLLGWELTTITGYENGSLQDVAHDRMLKLLKEPIAFLRLTSEINFTIFNNLNIVKSVNKCRELIKTKYSHNDCYKDILEIV